MISVRVGGIPRPKTGINHLGRDYQAKVIQSNGRLLVTVLKNAVVF